VAVDSGKIYRGQNGFGWELSREIESLDLKSVSGMPAQLRLVRVVASQDQVSVWAAATFVSKGER
jgi:hypothetical protein